MGRELAPEHIRRAGPERGVAARTRRADAVSPAATPRHRRVARVNVRGHAVTRTATATRA